MVTITDFIKKKPKKQTIIDIAKGRGRSDLNNVTEAARRPRTSSGGGGRSTKPSVVSVPAGGSVPIQTQPQPIKAETVQTIQQQSQAQVQREQFIRASKSEAPSRSPQNVITQPQITRTVVSSVRNPNTGRKIPVVEYKFVSPPPSGGGVSTSRPATADEIASTRSLNVSEPSVVPDVVRTTTGKISDTIGRIDYRASKTARKVLNLPEAGKEQRFKNIDLIVERKKSDLERIPNLYVRKFAQTGTEIGGQFLSSIGGFAETTLDSPIKRTGQSVAIGVGIGYGAGLLTAGASQIGGTTATVTTGAINVAGIGLGAAYAGTKLYNYERAGSTSGRGRVIGETAQEVLLTGGGFKIGEVGAINTQGFLATRGRVQIPIEELGILPSSEVLTGKKKFLESSNFGLSNRAGALKQSQDLKIFQRAGRSYSATPEGSFLKNQFTAQRGSSEFAGLYTAPSPSPYFLKVGGESGKVFGFYQGIGNPKLAQIQKGQFTTKGLNEEGKAFVTGIKPEIEAVYAEGTTFVRTNKQTYTVYKGRRIPQDVYEVATPSSNLNVKSVSDIKASYSSGGGSSAIINPTLSFGLSSSRSSSSSGSRSSIYSSSSSGPSRSSGSSSGSSGSGISGSGSFGSSGSSRSGSSFSGSPSYNPSSGSGYSRGGGSTFYYPPTPRVPRTPDRPPRYPRYNNVLSGSKPRGRFTVEVRRFGVFKPVATASSVSKAFSLGRQRVGGSLAASFRVRGVGGRTATPKGFTRSKKEKDVFIELPRYRLSRKGEKKEIASFRTGRLKV